MDGRGCYDLATVRYEIDKLQYLVIGQQGENNATTIEIDMDSWVQDLKGRGYDNPCFHLLFMPYNQTVPLTTNTTYDPDTKILSWVVTDSDTAFAGQGYTEIRGLNHPDNGLLKKSQVIPTTVNTSVTGVEGGTPPAPYDDWVNNILELITQLNNALNGATVEYAISENYSSVPVTGWQSMMPDLVSNKGKYLWTRTTISWSTGGVTQLHNVSYIATDASGAVQKVNGYEGNVVLDGADIKMNRSITGSPTLKASIEALQSGKLDAAKIVYSPTEPANPTTGMIWLKPKVVNS